MSLSLSLSRSLPLVGLLLGAGVAQAADWTIDGSHSSAAFTVRHMMVSNVHGTLGKVTGTAAIDDKDVTKSTVNASIDVNGIDTNEPKRDGHLKSPDFFNVAQFPSVTFKSSSVKKKGTHLTIAGDLTIHGVTKPVVLDAELTAPVKSPFGDNRRGVTASTKISRKDFGLAWNKAIETGGVVVGDEVKISLDIELTDHAPDAPKPAAAPAK